MYFNYPKSTSLKSWNLLLLKDPTPPFTAWILDISQFPAESIQKCTVWLKSAAIDCKFFCPSCQFDLVPVHVKDQFICELFNNTLQTDILAEAGHLKALEHKRLLKPQ